MCFSPEASFAGGVILSSIGVATVRKVHKPSQILFAAIPLFFGGQQIAEGFLWLALPHAEYVGVQKIFTYIFLLMAEVIWPMLIPLAVLLMEKDKKRRRTIQVLLGFGVALALYYSYCLLVYSVSPQIVDYHINYNTDFPDLFALPAFILYLIATITPLFVSSIKRTQIMGVLMFFSCLVTVIFFTQYLISVWCFFAALLSIVVYWILHESKIAFNLERLKLLAEKIKLPTTKQ